MIRATNYDPLPCPATTADRHRQTPENGFERSNYRAICASVERHRKCLHPQRTRPDATDTVDSLSPSLLPFFPLSTRSLAPRIAGWLISGVAKGHQCPPSASVRVPPSLVSALIEDLSSPPFAGHTCYVRPDPLSAGPVLSTSQSRKKRVARPFTRLSLCCLSFPPPQMAISKLVTALGSPSLVSASAQRSLLRRFPFLLLPFKLLSRQWANDLFKHASPLCGALSCSRRLCPLSSGGHARQTRRTDGWTDRWWRFGCGRRNHFTVSNPFRDRERCNPFARARLMTSVLSDLAVAGGRGCTAWQSG